MFDLKISSLKELKTYGPDMTKIISLIDPDGSELKEFEDHCIIRVDDINTELTVDNQDNTINNFTLPGREHIKSLLDYSKSFVETDNVLIHCHAGISRSTAASILVLCQHGLSPEDALAKVLELRPMAFPNNRFIWFGDQILDFNGKLIKVVDDWKKSTNEHFVNMVHTKVSEEDVDEMQSFKDLFD